MPEHVVLVGGVSRRCLGMMLSRASIMLQKFGAGNMRQSLALCIFAIGIIILSLRYSTTASLERPVVLSAFTLLLTSLCLAQHTRWKTGEAVSATQYLRQIAQSRTKAELLQFVAVPVALVLRAFFFRHTLWWTQCTVPGVFTALPALLVVADWLWPQHDYTALAGYDRSPSPPQGMWFHLTTITEKHSEMRSRFPARHAALAASWAVLANRILVLTARTTGAVCPTGTSWPAAGDVQILCLGFDGTALFLMGRRMRKQQQSEEDKPLTGPHGGRLAGEFLAAAAIILLLLLSTSPFATTSLRELAASSYSRGLVVRDLLLDSILATGVLLSGLYLLACFTPITLALVGGAAFLSVHHNLNIVHGYGVSHSGSPIAIITGVLTLGCLVLLSQDTIRLDTEVSSRLSNHDKIQHKKRLIACLAIISLLLGINYASAILIRPHDPIPAIQAAQNAANDWIFEAGKSQTAQDAAAAYKARYALPPPPHFDKWYAFARKHNSPVIDAFDQIHADLLPLWGLSPAALRERTSRLITSSSSQPQLGIGGLRIRGGKVALHPAGNTPGTHMWMMEAYRDMVAPFAASLPDMDVAFNLDDEPRVAMPADVLSQLREEGKGPLHVLTSSRANGHPLRPWFSKTAVESAWNDAASSLYLGKKEHHHRHNNNNNKGTTALFKHFSKKKPRAPVYDAYVAPTCPSDSAALRYKWWDGSRALPEAQGGIISTNPDLCNRPDLARMHGFLISPAAFVVTQQAMPIFSQARVDGFNDILVPSPWNYVDKVNVESAADMEWQLKDDTFYWRGSGSDGFAEGNKWPGFLRARLVYLTQTLPSGLFSSIATTSTSSALPAVDVSFTGNFTHCDPDECRGETATFYGHAKAADPPKTDFQEHFAYRHLIDVDGAGFSGRFLPFLRSKSAAYRATLFRTWYDERVHPWKHYVPLDVSLSGLWDVVWLVSKKLIVKQGDSQASLAEQIATDGHDWAARALRKEDMQIYMFRLLLEWGRLVDDDREELGYDP